MLSPPRANLLEIIKRGNRNQIPRLIFELSPHKRFDAEAIKNFVLFIQANTFRLRCRHRRRHRHHHRCNILSFWTLT